MVNAPEGLNHFFLGRLEREERKREREKRGHPNSHVVRTGFYQCCETERDRVEGGREKEVLSGAHNVRACDDLSSLSLSLFSLFSL